MRKILLLFVALVSLSVVVQAGPGVKRFLYLSTPDGAQDGLSTNDLPDTAESAPTTVQLGDGAALYRGLWLSDGDEWLKWRRGAIVFTVQYQDEPGFENLDEIMAVAESVDAACGQVTVSA